MKKVLALVLALAMSLSLVACGGGDSSTAGGSQAAGGSSTAAEGDYDGKLLYYVVEPFLCKHYDKMERQDVTKRAYKVD